MGLLWMDGFEGYGTTGAPSPTGIMVRRYANAYNEVGATIVAGRFGGYCWHQADGYLITPPLTTNATMIVGFAVKMTTTPGAAPLLWLYDGAQSGVNLRVEGTNSLAVYRYNTLLGTSTAVLTPGVWSYVELKVTCGTSGSFELKFNGATVLSASGVNTKSGEHDYHTACSLQSVWGGISYDDFYVLDGNGAPNDFLGNVKIVAIAPEGDGASADWTCSAGSDHFALVNENPADNDTTYVEATTGTDVWDYTAVAALDSILGIQINTDARITDATSYNLKAMVVSGASTLEGAAQAVNSNFTTYRQVAAVDPLTGVAWTISGLNAAQFGVKVG